MGSLFSLLSSLDKTIICLIIISLLQEGISSLFRYVINVAQCLACS